MTLALAGHGAPPEWYLIAAAAEAWGMAPWELEEHAPALWMDRFAAVKNAESQVAKRKRLPAVGGAHSMELL